MGPRIGLDVGGKSRPLPGFDPRTVQPVANYGNCWICDWMDPRNWWPPAFSIEEYGMCWFSTVGLPITAHCCLLNFTRGCKILRLVCYCIGDVSGLM